MLELLTHCFAVVCGQNPAHTWAPGGMLLPCCQRCTGLYSGAGLALILHLVIRPRLSGRFLYVHGAFLLLMVPFGYHWVPQGPLSRTITGFAFGVGIITFLWVSVARRLSSWAGSALVVDQPHKVYAGALLTCVFSLLLGVQLGGAVSAVIISISIAAGVVSIAGLIAVNAMLALLYTRGFVRALKPRERRAAANQDPSQVASRS